MCIMTKAFSSQTGFSCSWLCSSHNISVDNKNILMLGHDDIPHPAGLEPTSALLQNRQLFLGKNDCALQIDHSLHKFSFSTNKAAEQAWPSAPSGTGAALLHLLMAHTLLGLSRFGWCRAQWERCSLEEQSGRAALRCGVGLSCVSCNGSGKAGEPANVAWGWREAEPERLQTESSVEDTEKAWRRQIILWRVLESLPSRCFFFQENESSLY